jgi:hypothetical protein
MRLPVHDGGEDGRARVGDPDHVEGRVGSKQPGGISGGHDLLDLGRRHSRDQQVGQERRRVDGVDGSGDDDPAVAVEGELGHGREQIGRSDEAAAGGDPQDQLARVGGDGVPGRNCRGCGRVGETPGVGEPAPAPVHAATIRQVPRSGRSLCMAASLELGVSAGRSTRWRLVLPRLEVPRRGSW